MNICLFFTNTYPIWFIKRLIQFNANVVVENHIRSCGSAITNNVQLYDSNNHINFLQSTIFNPSNLSNGYMFIYILSSTKVNLISITHNLLLNK